MSLFDRTMRERREELGIGQAALAEKVGVSQQTISRWEKGEVVPPPKRLAKVAEALKLDLDQMLAYAGYLPTGGAWPHWQQLSMLYEQMSAFTADELLTLIERAVQELRSRGPVANEEQSQEKVQAPPAVNPAPPARR